MSNKSDKELNVEIGKLLRDARRDHQLTQDDLALAIERSKNQVSSLERGICKISVEILLGYCKALNITPNELLGYTGLGVDPELYVMISAMDAEKQEKLKKLIRMMEDF